MLNFYTTWHTSLLLCPYLRKNENRGLLTLSTIISGAGIAMAYGNMVRGNWYWKNNKISLPLYLSLEMIIHQLPVIVLLKYNPRGNAWNALIPVSIYCSLIDNPYKICGLKLKNYYSFCLIIAVAPIINRIMK
mgnify:CR=1 FL=1